MFHNDCLDFMHIHSKDEPIHGFDLSKEFLVFLYNVLNDISFESTSVHCKHVYIQNNKQINRIYKGKPLYHYIT